MEKVHANSISRREKVVSTSSKPTTDKDTYSYARVRLPLLRKNFPKEQKSTSNYSTPSSKRPNQGYYHKLILKKGSKHADEKSSRNFVTDRNRSQSKNPPFN